MLCGVLPQTILIIFLFQSIAANGDEDSSSEDLNLTNLPKPRSLTLGDVCTTDNMCISAYSECKGGRCTCMDGMEQHKQKCQALVRSCPYGDALVSGGKTLKCDPDNSDTPPPAQDEDNAVEEGAASANRSCPTDYFCLKESEVSYGKSKGFCCPKPKNCPVGKASTVIHTCNYGETTENITYCPYDSHYCYRVNVASSISFELCCRKPCDSSEVYRNGKCYAPRAPGEKCKYTDECAPNNGVCKDGICVCEQDQIDVSGRCQIPYCTSPIDSLTAIKLPNNVGYLRCNATKECPSQSYCADGKFCCPVPAAYCYQTSSYVSPNDQCDPNGPASQCGPGKSCNTWYSALSNSTSGLSVSIGLCCRNS